MRTNAARRRRDGKASRGQADRTVLVLRRLLAAACMPSAPPPAGLSSAASELPPPPPPPPVRTSCEVTGGRPRRAGPERRRRRRPASPSNSHRTLSFSVRALLRTHTLTLLLLFTHSLFFFVSVFPLFSFFLFRSVSAVAVGVPCAERGRGAAVLSCM